jgi:hypothetical protein
MKKMTPLETNQEGSKFLVSYETIRTYLEEMNISYYKKQRVPSYTDQQLNEVPTRARRLYRMLSNDDFELILDDEKYFQLSDPEVKFKRTGKFEPKILVWIAVSTNGVSSCLFAKQRQAINETTYLNECIKKRLMPFINDCYDKDKVLFWPDLVSSHYSNTVRQYLDQNGIQFVNRNFIPQNCPQARPIETLWSILKDMVYDQG